MIFSLKKSNWITVNILLLMVAIPAYAFGMEPFEKNSGNIDHDILLLLIYVFVALGFRFYVLLLRRYY